VSTINYFDVGGAKRAAAGDLIGVDLAKPYVYQWTGNGSSFCHSTPHELLALPPDTLRIACRQVDPSPLYELVRQHLICVARDTETVAADPAAAGVGFASGGPFRALMASASHDAKHAAQTAAATLLTRVGARAHIQPHLHERDLHPETIAGALIVSPRQIFGRLIGSIVRRIGFADASRFSRRFKTACGVSRREWCGIHDPTEHGTPTRTKWILRSSASGDKRRTFR
jgi:AraC-like DNA-binding protein